MKNNFDKEGFATNLKKWFYQEKRDVPWRENRDPYRIWVSEIMLQQTKVNTVIPYFLRFMEQFPTITDLANAEEETVLKAWEGLGYYSRARNLHAAAKEVKVTYGGKVPDTKETLSTLKGVGPYTTGAILSIAFGVPAPAVDGNVMRVLSRILYITDDIAKAKTRKTFESVVTDIISHEDPSAFNQGLMELGATICTPTSPACLLCPVQLQCEAFALGIQEALPVKSKKTPPKYQPMIAGVFSCEDGFLVRKRPSKGLLANMWEFPNLAAKGAGSKKEQLTRYMEEKYGIQVEIEDYLTNVQHTFTHLHWDIDVFIGKMTKSSKKIRPVSFAEMEQLPFSVSHQKIKASVKRRVQL